MNKVEALQQLHHVFCHLYSDISSIRIVLDEIGLDTKGSEPSKVDAADLWQQAISEADQYEMLRELIEYAGFEHPEYVIQLAQLLFYYRQEGPTRQLSFVMPRMFRLSNGEQELLTKMFPLADKLEIIKEFTDGYSATRVLLCRPTGDGRDALQAVIKMGERTLIEKEWQATQYHLLDQVLPNFVAVQSPPTYVYTKDGMCRGGLFYQQVGAGIFHVENLSRYAISATIDDIWHVLKNRLLAQLDALWKATWEWTDLDVRASYDSLLPVNFLAEPGVVPHGMRSKPVILLDGLELCAAGADMPEIQQGGWIELENFEVTEINRKEHEVTLNLPRRNQKNAQSYRLRLNAPELCKQIRVGERLPPTACQVLQLRSAKLLALVRKSVDSAVDLSQPSLSLPDVDDIWLPNPLLILPKLLQRSQKAGFATIHGDLNLRNILVDIDARSTYIIDCASARCDHVLHDLLRLERDILTGPLTEVFFQSELSFADIYTLLLSVHCAVQGDPHEPGQFALPKELPPILQKFYLMLVTIRRAAIPILNPDVLWKEYYAGLTIHLLGSLKFKDFDNAPSGHQPKAIAFWSAAIITGFYEGMGSCENLSWQPLHMVDPPVSEGETPH